MKGPDGPRYRWVLIVCLVVALVFVLALIVATVGSPDDGTIGFELRKYVIQFLLIVALGAVVAFVVDVLKRRAEREEEERRKNRETADRERQYAIDTVASLLDRLDEAYRATKRKRRLLRHIALKNMSREAYTDAMWKLNDDKQEIEKLWRDIEVLERWLPELKPIRPRVKAMEDYLDPLEHEWESVSAKPDDEFRPEALTALEGFHSKWSAGKSTFPSFRTPYYEARKDLMKLLANRRTGIEPAGRDRGSSTPRA